jgi:cadmium resistance protein CadD (predicted permease)
MATISQIPVGRHNRRNHDNPSHRSRYIIIIIIIFINCKWVDTRWSIYILHMHGLSRLITLDLVGGGLHGKHVVAAWKGKRGTIPAFALGPRKTKKNLCRDGRSQDLPVTDF